MKYDTEAEVTSFIDAVNDISEGSGYQLGMPKRNLSFWDPGDEYRDMMSPLLRLPRETELFNYRYNNTLDRSKELLYAFGVNEQIVTKDLGYALITPNSTSSIVLLLQALKRAGRRRLAIVSPGYFSVRMIALDFDMTCVKEMDQADVIWVTSPVLGTGEALSEDFLHELKRRHKQGATLVFDESFALPGKELCRKFDLDERIFFIYSPHKVISVNAIKFSCVLSPSKWGDLIQGLQDYYAGSLQNSTIEAVVHYLYGNYKTECVPAYLDYTERRYREFVPIVKAYPFAHLAQEHSGHYQTIFTDFPHPSKGEYLKLLERVFRKTDYIFYPSNIEDFYRKDAKLSFRVNLLEDREHCIEGTKKVLEALWHDI